MGIQEHQFFRPIWDNFDGELLQDLVVDLLRAEDFIVEPSGVGPDGGIDAFAQQWIRYGYNNPESFVWAIQCKFTANPKKSITPTVVGEILSVISDERFKSKQISGYFLVTNSRLSANMMTQLRGLNDKLPGFKTTYWDMSAINELLNKHFRVYSKYFWTLIDRTTDTEKPLGEKDPIRQFEELLNSTTTSEADIAAFFEAYPSLLTKALNAGPNLITQPRLQSEDGSIFIPDFLLQPKGQNDQWAIVELKKPSDKLVVGNDKKVRFSQEMMNGYFQLRMYRDYFESAENLDNFRKTSGLEVLRPRTVLIVGKDYGPLSGSDVIRAKSQFPELELMTHTELLQRMKG